jgi:hypothetical protein
MAILHKADGTKEKLTPSNTTKFSLEDLQKAVGGYIEGIPGTNHRVWCDEEGLLKGKPHNLEASMRFGRRLVGDILELEPGDKQ